MKRLNKAVMMTCGAAAFAAPQLAAAQTENILIEPSLPPGYDRGRNVSVQERPRPDYDALGIRVGSVLVYPRLDVGGGYSDNIFLSESDRTGAVYAVVAPSVRANSNWSRHLVSASASGVFRRFAGNAVRNEDNWSTGVLGRLDATTDARVTAEVQAGRLNETPFSGGVESEIPALSNYRYNLASVRAEYEPGRNRFAMAYNRSTYDFSDFELGDGTVFRQGNRDRTIHGFVGQVERAMTPTTSIYGQISYSDTAYASELAPGIANRDSKGYRVVAGLSMDLPAFLRGTVALGYTWRNYASAVFPSVQGLSGDAKLEYFPSELTTFTLRARRLIQDSSLGSASAFFDNRLTLTVDHELLRNLILSSTADLAVQNYIDSPEELTVYRLGGRGRYLISRQLSADVIGTYSHREREVAAAEGNLNEFRVEATLSLRL
jgi:hypothetical protein